MIRSGILWGVAVSAIGALLYCVYSGVHAFETECRLRLWEKCRFDGNSAFYDQDYRQALEKYQEALGYSRRLEKNSFRIGVSLAHVASAEEALHNFTAAERLYRQSVEELDKVRYKDSQSLRSLLLEQDLTESLNDLGNILLKLNRVDEAEPYFKRALSIGDRLVNGGGSMSKDRTISQQRVISLAGLADISFRRRDFKKAEPLYNDALTLAEETLVPESLNEKIRVNMALMLQSSGRGANLGKILPDMDWQKQVTKAESHMINARWQQAEKCLREAVHALDQYGLDDVRLAVTLGKLGSVLIEQHKDNQAIPILIRAIDIERKLHKSYDEDMDANMHRLAVLYINRGQFDRAEPLLKEQITLREISFGPDDYSVAEMSGNLAYVLSRNGKKDDAKAMASRAYDRLKDQERSRKKFRVTRLFRNMSYIFIDAGDYERAEGSLRQALEILKVKPGNAQSKSLFFASVYAILGDVLLRKNEPAKAAEELQKALDLAGKSHGQPGQQGIENRILLSYATAAARLGDSKKAAALEERRKRLQPEGLDETYTPAFEE